MPGGESAVSRRAGGWRLPACPHDCPPRVDMTARRVDCPATGSCRRGGGRSVVAERRAWCVLPRVEGVSVVGRLPAGRVGESAASRLPAALPRLAACRHDCPPPRRVVCLAACRHDFPPRSVEESVVWGVLVSCRRLREDRVSLLCGLVRRVGDPARLPAASTTRRVASTARRVSPCLACPPRLALAVSRRACRVASPRVVAGRGVGIMGEAARLLPSPSEFFPARRMGGGGCGYMGEIEGAGSGPRRWSCGCPCAFLVFLSIFILHFCR